MGVGLDPLGSQIRHEQAPRESSINLNQSLINRERLSRQIRIQISGMKTSRSPLESPSDRSFEGKVVSGFKVTHYSLAAIGRGMYYLFEKPFPVL